MSRSACVNRFGVVEGDRFYKRFHTMKTKARHSGAEFAWTGFEDFWIDFLDVAPADFAPKTHRLKFKLDQPGGYCKDNMEVYLKYFGKSGKVNPKVASALVEQMLRQPGAVSHVVTTELVNRIVDKARSNVENLELNSDQEAIGQAVERATEIAWRLDKRERQTVDALLVGLN
jgi:hypothetical protein